MQRIENWPTQLDAFLIANRERAFVYGSWDCFQFVRGAVQAMCESDIAAPFAPYRSRFGYLRQMVRYCESFSLIAFARRLLAAHDCVEIPPGRAGRGDVVMIGGDDPALGLVALNGRNALVLTRAQGIARVPLTLAIAAWKI
jgi:hypothetical protein